MLDAEDLLNGIVRGALGGRRKSSRRAARALRGSGLINARTLLAAAGVAWGLYETWQGQQATAASSAPPPGAPAATPPPLPTSAPPPLPSDAPAHGSDEDGVPAPIARLLRIMISAARADGELGPTEREHILSEAREVGGYDLVQRELEAPRPLAELVAGVSDPALAEQLYTLAFVVVRADEAVTGAERIYLAQLANRLGLDAAAVSRIEGAAAARIDATPPDPESN